MTENKDNFQEYTIKTRRPIIRSMSSSQPNSQPPSSTQHTAETLTLPQSTEPYTSTDVVDIQEKLSFDEKVPVSLISEFLTKLPSRNFVNLFISFLRDSDTIVRQFVATDFLNNTPQSYASFFIQYKKEHRNFYALPDLIEKRTKVLNRLTSYISTNIDTQITDGSKLNSAGCADNKPTTNTPNTELAEQKEPLLEAHTNNKESVNDSNLTPTIDRIINFSKQLESIIFSSQSFIFNKYKNKAFVLLQNLKNNKELCEELLSGSINTSQLMTMKEEELANSAIRNQRYEISKKTFNERVIKKEDHYFSIATENEVFDEVVEKLPTNEVETDKERRFTYRYHFSISTLKSQAYPSIEIKAIEIHSELSNDIQLSELTAINHHRVRQLLESVKETGISGSINLEKIVVFINHLISTKRRIIIPFRIANSAKRIKQFLMFRKVLNESRKAAVIDLEQSNGLLLYLFPYLDSDLAVKNDSIVGNLFSNLVGLLGVDLKFAKQKGFENDGFCICIIDPERLQLMHKFSHKTSLKSTKSNSDTANSNLSERKSSGNWDSSVYRERNNSNYNEEYNDDYYGYNKRKKSNFDSYYKDRRWNKEEGNERVNKRAKVYRPKYEYDHKNNHEYYK